MDDLSKSGLVQADINVAARAATYDTLPTTAFHSGPTATYGAWYGTVYETDLEVYAQPGPGGAPIGVISDVTLTLGFSSDGYWRVDGIRCRSSSSWFPLPVALYPFVAEGLALQAERIDQFIADEARELRQRRRAS